MNIQDGLMLYAEKSAQDQNSVFLLNGRMIYPDEIFSEVGFLPLIARVAQKCAKRLLATDQVSECGFVYTPFTGSLFCEKIDIRESDAGVLPDALRLSMLINASQSVVGLDHPGTVDLTPIYDYFMEVQKDERVSRLEAIDESQLPLFRPMQIQ